MPTPLTQSKALTEVVKAANVAMRVRNWLVAAESWGQCLTQQQVRPNPLHQAQLAICYLRLQRLDDARTLLDTAMLVHPFDFGLNVQLAELANLEKNDLAAIKSWCVCLALFPDKVKVNVFRKLALALRRSGDTVQARNIIKRGLERYANEPSLLIEWAETETQDQNFKQAADLWLLVIQYYRVLVSVGIYMSCCQALVKSERYDESLKLLRLALGIYPNEHRILKKISEVEALNKIEVLILADVENTYRITYYKQKEPANTIVFTFASLYKNLESAAFGFPFLVAEGFDHVHVAHGVGKQYQELSLDVFEAVARPLLGDKRVFTYGSSLGAYAAIYYASAIQACAVASNPTLPAHPLATRFPAEKITIQHLSFGLIQVTNRVYVFYDPQDVIDSRFLCECIAPACRDMVLIPLPYSGHQSLRMLASSGVFQKTMRHIFSDLPDTIQIDEEKLQPTSIYLEELTLHQEREGQLLRALVTGQQCLALEPRLRVTNAVIRMALKLGQHELAQQTCRDAILHFPLNKVTPIPESVG